MKAIILLTAFLAVSKPPKTEAVILVSKAVPMQLEGINGNTYHRTTCMDIEGNTYHLLLPERAQPKAGKQLTIVHDELPYVYIHGKKYFDYSTTKIVKP